jgi:hypothetical protein
MGQAALKQLPSCNFLQFLCFSSGFTKITKQDAQSNYELWSKWKQMSWKNFEETIRRRNRSITAKLVTNDDDYLQSFRSCGKGSTTNITEPFLTFSLLYQQLYNNYHYIISFNFSVLQYCIRAASDSKEFYYTSNSASITSLPIMCPLFLSKTQKLFA